jgi:hypothetical protein
MDSASEKPGAFKKQKGRTKTGLFYLPSPRFKAVRCGGIESVIGLSEQTFPVGLNELKRQDLTGQL